MSITKRIYDVMKHKKMKQSLVAAAAGYDVRMFNNMLRGRKIIPAEAVPGICAALEITPNELFGIGPKRREYKGDISALHQTPNTQHVQDRGLAVIWKPSGG